MSVPDILGDDQASQTQQPMNPFDRVRALQQQSSQAVTCEKCGGSWFFEAEFNQYRGGMYSSAPGGDHHVISAMPQRIRICACGNPISPNIGGTRGGRQPNQEISSFLSTINAAKQHREAVAEVDRKMTELVPQIASQEELSALQLKVEELIAQVQTLKSTNAAGAREVNIPPTDNKKTRGKSEPEGNEQPKP